jgi:1-acyl-sn-glycerol-3-phosphate acyltransferase
MGGVERMGSPALRVWRLAIYLAFTLLLMPVQAFGLLFRRPWAATFPRFYHRWCCRILGLRVRRIGRPTKTRPVLFAANHISYLDITVFGSLIVGSFIAKREVKNWPLFGWLARIQRTLINDRLGRTTHKQPDSIAGRLAAKEALILFPEGTSGDGNRVLPFKSALFSVADHAATGPVTVQPVSIAYTRLDGMPIGRRLRPLFAWYGSMALAPHLWTLLGLGTVEIVVEFHQPVTLADRGSRKALARYCQERVAAGLANAVSGRRGPRADAVRETQPLPAPADPAETIAPALG